MGTEIPRDSSQPGSQHGCAQMDGENWGAPDWDQPRREVKSETGEGQGGALAVLLSLQIISQQASLLWSFACFEIKELFCFCR